MGGDREETRRPPGLRHAPRHQSLSSWAAIERRHGGRLACAMPQGINRWGVGAVLGAAASSSEPGGQARGQASTVASGGGGAGTGRDEERGHDRTPERAGLGASSMFITLTSSPFVLAAEPQGRSTRLRNFGGDGEKYGVEKIKIRCSRGIPPRRRSAPRFLISVRAPALLPAHWLPSPAAGVRAEDVAEDARRPRLPPLSSSLISAPNSTVHLSGSFPTAAAVYIRPLL
jgi:hypothetical protein